MLLGLFLGVVILLLEVVHPLSGGDVLDGEHDDLLLVS